MIDEEMEIMRPPLTFKQEEYQKRIERFRKLLLKDEIDGAVITRGVTRLYFTGFDSTAGTLIIDAQKGPILIVDHRYILMAKKACPFIKCELQKGKLFSVDLVKAHVQKWDKIALEMLDAKETIDDIFFRTPKVMELIEAEPLLKKLRSKKTACEIKKIREACTATDKLFTWATEQIEPGMTEWEVRYLFRKGADIFGHGESFDTIVCAGANGAECHHKPGDTVIGKRDSVLIDFGLLLDHYHTDMTRSFCFGKPSKLYQKIYDIVLEAHDKAIEAIEPGYTGGYIDKIAREVIENNGYGTDFGHSLGHAVGLEIHESPGLTENTCDFIRPGMVLTVEPGIYIAGKLGIRIEDIVLVTNHGCEVLYSTPTALMIR